MEIRVAKTAVREAGDLRAPHRVAHYLEDLAATYHKIGRASCRERV